MEEYLAHKIAFDKLMEADIPITTMRQSLNNMSLDELVNKIILIQLKPSYLNGYPEIKEEYRKSCENTVENTVERTILEKDILYNLYMKHKKESPEKLRISIVSIRSIAVVKDILNPKLF